MKVIPEEYCIIWIIDFEFIWRMVTIESIKHRDIYTSNINNLVNFGKYFRKKKDSRKKNIYIHYEINYIKYQRGMGQKITEDRLSGFK